MKETREELQRWARSVGARLVADQEEIALQRRIRRLGLDPRLVLRASEFKSREDYERIKQEIGATETL